MIFPSDNLPRDAKPWARAVTSELSNVIDVVSTSEVSNALRDTQLSTALISLSGAVLDAQQAISDVTAIVNNIYVDGTTELDGGVLASGTLSASKITTGALNASLITTGTLNASLITVTNLSASSITTGSLSGSRITGGTITGTTISGVSIIGGTITGAIVETASSGTRVKLNSSNIAFYFGSTYAGSIEGSDNSWSDPTALIMSSSNDTCRVTVENSAASIAHLGTNGGQIGCVSNGIDLYGAARFYSNVRGPGITATGFLQSENYSGGGTTAANINDNGTIVRGSSSARYKQDIEDLDVDYSAVLSLQPKKFKLKDEATTNPNARYYAGFIAEEMDQIGLKDFVSYMKTPEGTLVPDGVYYGELTSALVSALKHQDSLIKSLSDRISTLEGN